MKLLFHSNTMNESVNIPVCAVLPDLTLDLSPSCTRLYIGHLFHSTLFFASSFALSHDISKPIKSLLRSLSSSSAVFLISFFSQEPNVMPDWLFYHCPCATRNAAGLVKI